MPSRKGAEVEILGKADAFARVEFGKDSSGHDYWHSWRVRNLARKIAEGECRKGGASPDFLVVELAALLHDLADFKFKAEKGEKELKKFLQRIGLNEGRVEKVLEVVSTVSFKGAGVKTKPKSLEGKIVQDADRLDALGAVGVARCFAYGGMKGRKIWEPGEKMILHDSFADYKKSGNSSVAHFYEKLLLLKERLNTKTARKMAGERHEFLKAFLKEFYNEWLEGMKGR
jgi:uncharacterized protein